VAINSTGKILATSVNMTIKCFSVWAFFIADPQFDNYNYCFCGIRN
jgi:hypothetical protein